MVQAWLTVVVPRFYRQPWFNYGAPTMVYYALCDCGFIYRSRFCHGAASGGRQVTGSDETPTEYVHLDIHQVDLG